MLSVREQFPTSAEVTAVDENLSVLIFRLAAAWLALPTSVCREVAEQRAIHTLPHRRGGILLGLVNIRGEIRLCVSLKQFLGLLPGSTASETKSPHTAQRLLVVARASDHWVLLVDEIHGIVQFPADALQHAPVRTSEVVPHCPTRHLSWQAHEVGYLDPTCLFTALSSAIL